MAKHYMNPQLGKHLGDNEGEGKTSPQSSGDVDQGSGQHKAPDIHITTADSGHTVKAIHQDKAPEESVHQLGDTDSVLSSVRKHLAGKGGEPMTGQSHGYSSGSDMENEWGGGGPGV
jgi:hypothetical protein